MGESAGETKGPKEETKVGGGDQINLKVKDQDNAEVHFKVRATTKFSKIFEAYCSKKSVARDHVRFLFDGQRINPESTPSEARRREPAAAFLTRPRAAQLEMEDGDSIDAMMEQVGGAV